MSPTKSLRDQGWRMPAEWESHHGTWMSWPARTNTSFPGGNHHDLALPTFIQIIEAITPRERLYLNVTDARDRRYVESNLSSAAQRNLVLTDIPAVYPWCRDHGAIFVVNDESGELAAISWEYNAWGGKYPEAVADNHISSAMAKSLGLQEYEAGIVLEGGSIDVNGCGTLVTTESCLLNQNRNPHLSRNKIEQYLRDFLGQEKILWLHDGIMGDDTDGHIDDITRFINTETVVTVVETDESDANFRPLMDNYESLCGMTTEDGTPLNVITLPMPKPLIYENERLPASYANFYIFNGAVLVPVFDDPSDELAIHKLQECFVDRKIIPLDSRALVWGLGSFHCLTQQVPTARSK
jgi:agmatine deiminase